MKNKYKHLLFDLDNTFWSVDDNQKCAIEELFNSYGMKKYFSNFDDFFQKFLTLNSKLWLDYRDNKVTRTELRNNRFIDLLKNAGLKDTDTAMRMSDEYLRITPTYTILLDGSLEILEYLKKQGYRMSLVTNGFNEVQFAKVENSGMGGYFEEIITSEFAGCNKPARGIFDYAVEQTGCQRNEILMIGDDAYNDVYGARQAGLDCVFLNVDSRAHEQSPTFEIQHLLQLKEIL